MNMPTQLCPGEGYPELNYRGLARWRDAGWNQRIGGCVNPQNPEPSGLLARDKPTSGYVAINYRILQPYQEQATTTILCCNACGHILLSISELLFGPCCQQAT